MFRYFTLAFILLVIAEIYAVVWVAGKIGVGNMLVLLFICSVVGLWLTKRVGVSVLTRLRTTVDAGEMPANELIDGGLVLSGGVLLTFPGFVSDILGLLLLFPLTRGVARNSLRRRFRARFIVMNGRTVIERGDDNIIDV